jgi:hypothetical protein
MKAYIREALWFHLLFFAISAPVLLFARGEMLGKGLLALTLGYNIALPLFALMRGHGEWLKLWTFLLPLSCGQVFPDWALVQIGNVLSFSDHGVWRIGGAVPLYFMGLWIMLLFPITLISDSNRSRYLIAGILSLLLFGFWEWAAPMLELWHPLNVRVVAGVAVYVLIPEVFLGLVTLQVYRRTKDSGIIQQVFSAFAVNLLYTGALFIGLLLTRALL